MQLCVFALTVRGAVLARRIKDLLNKAGHSARLFINEEYAEREAGEHLIAGNLPQLVGDWFSRCDGMIMIMAAGIAVRVIAPYLRDKKSDPAVVVMDERGQFAISLLSGHLGGANRLAEMLADHLRATPVITTASDVNKTLALDELACRRGWRIENYPQLKRVSAALVNRQEVVLAVDRKELLGSLTLPDNIHLLELDRQPQLPLRVKDCRAAVFISSRAELPQLPINSLIIRPRTVIVGVGCRRGAGGDEIRNALEEALRRADRTPLAVKCLATIDLKRNERGLQLAAEELGWPLVFIPRAKLIEVEDHFPVSPEVKRRVGVGAVCEPAAFLAGRRPQRVLGKTVFPGVTVAVYEDRE